MLPADRRLAEIPGVSLELARAIIAETGLDMTRFPTAGHLASWAGLAPAARQSGPRARKPKKGQGDAYLKGYCTQAATGAAKTETFLGERSAACPANSAAPGPCAVARSILVILWHLLADPDARFADLSPDCTHAKPTHPKPQPPPSTSYTSPSPLPPKTPPPPPGPSPTRHGPKPRPHL